MPLYSPPNYSQIAMGMQQQAAQSASAMRPGSKTETKPTKSTGDAIGGAVSGGLAGATLAGTEVGGAALGAIAETVGLSASAGGPIGMGIGALAGLASFFL